MKSSTIWNPDGGYRSCCCWAGRSVGGETTLLMAGVLVPVLILLLLVDAAIEILGRGKREGFILVIIRIKIIQENIKAILYIYYLFDLHTTSYNIYIRI